MRAPRAAHARATDSERGAERTRSRPPLVKQGRMEPEPWCEAPPIPSTARSVLPVREHGAQEAVADRAADSGGPVFGARRGSGQAALFFQFMTVGIGPGMGTETVGAWP